MPYINPTCLTHVASDILTASDWNSAKDNFTSLMTDPSTFGQILPKSGGIATGSFRVLGNLDVSSALMVPGSADFGTVNADSAFFLNNAPTVQLLQRVHVFTTNSRGSASTVFSTYLIASITAINSRSTILVRAGIYLRADGNATPSVSDANLVRNPTVATSLALLTDSSNGGTGYGGVVYDTAVSVQQEVQFERVDSSGNLDPKQYGINWHRSSGTPTVGAIGGHVTLEEWL